MDPLFSVEGQVVLVSGASRGIGRAIAAGFAQRGAQVIITGRDPTSLQKTAAEISGQGQTVYPYVCNVAQPIATARMVEELIDRFGRIDTLVNCAGVNVRRRAEDYDEATYDYITNINIRGAFFLTTAVGRHMKQARQGCIINIDSINSHTPLRYVSVYAMSKAALREMTKCLAMEWGPYGIRVNAIGPGFTLTDLGRRLWENPAMEAWRQANTPLGRIGLPEDMVGACIFLASPAASYITGQVLYIDGGTLSGLFWPLEVDSPEAPGSPEG
ncbi:MAG: SDR family oxidoreductase [Thermoguttaceae bacterium]|nr:SDR family oxidoreductase [Thermoguttaceae bacterium]MDW8039234.1 SDR family oxidoreductase [Thermoguttaceae bacterium]